MAADQGAFEGLGGVQIKTRRWEPARPARASVVLAHGLSEHMGRYEHVAAALNEAGFSLDALDHRGHGLSEGARADIESMEAVVADLRTLIGHVRERSPSTPLYLLGHSMGGAIALSYATRHDDEIEGLILSSPATSLGAASWATRAVSKFLGSVAPHLGVYTVDSYAISRDPQVVRDYDDDPLVFRGRVPARTVGVLTRAIEGFPRTAPRVTTPVYVFHGGGDEIVPPRATSDVHAFVSSEDRTMRIFDGLYHECMNEPERAEVIGAIVDWVDERLSG